MINDIQKKYLKFLEKLNVITIKQQSKGMGNIRREAIKEATLKFPKANYFCWLEPEKPDIVKFIIPLVKKMELDNAALGSNREIKDKKVLISVYNWLNPILKNAQSHNDKLARFEPNKFSLNYNKNEALNRLRLSWLGETDDVRNEVKKRL